MVSDLACCKIGPTIFVKLVLKTQLGTTYNKIS